MMPPVASPICKFAGCTKPRHIYPGGWRCQYCDEHMKYRKAKSRDGQESMTGPMRDILTYLRECRADGHEWVALEYPFAHGTTIKGLIRRDWIFESYGIDGSVKYKITGRGLGALNIYEPARQRRDGICPRCNERPRAVTDGRRVAYCAECERERNRQRHSAGKADGDPQRPCSRCGKRPRYQYPGGRLSTYCQHCTNVLRRQNARKNERRLFKEIQKGAPVPLCQHCHQHPRYVSVNSVNPYCLGCLREKRRLAKATRAFRHVFQRVQMEAALGL